MYEPESVAPRWKRLGFDPAQSATIFATTFTGTKLVQDATGAGAATPVAATGTTSITGAYGTLVLAADGSYTYNVANSNATVEALRTSANTLTDTFTYTLKDGSSLPAGLALDSATGHIAGTPTATTSGATHITVVATDKLGLTAQQMFDLTVNPPPVPVLLAANDNAGAVTGDVSATVTRIAPASGTVTYDNRISVSATLAGDMTVEGWFKTDATSSSTGQQVLLIGTMSLYITNGVFKSWEWNGGEQTILSSVDSNWHHYALTTDGSGTWKVLVDGVQMQSRAGYTISSSAASKTIYVGGSSSDAAAAFRGQISNVQVWDTQRTADQIAQDMHSLYLGGKDSTGAAPTGLVGAWVLASDTSNQVSGGLAATVGSATSSEARSSYTTDDATPTLSGTLNVALSSDQSLVLMEGGTEVPATVTMGTTGLTWSLTPTTPLSASAHDLVVKIKETDGTYSASTRDVLHVTVLDGVAPTFANATQTVDVAENTTATSYIGGATDNVVVTAYAFGGGADDELFNIDATTGALTFKAAPNFETPSSAAHSNAYTVKVKASDAMGNYSTPQTITVNVTDVNEAPTAHGMVDAVTATIDTVITARPMNNEMRAP